MSVYKADLHVHSLFSKIEEGILKSIIQSESYTSPEQVYRTARKRGMDFVTITDHNTIEGGLEIAHLKNVFLSEEVTARFPEDKCDIHVITLDINETQHGEIQRLKQNIYELVEYLRTEKILHFVAHPFSSANSKLKRENWEKMLLLFDIFEARNGVQKEKDNHLVEQILQNLSPEKIDQLANRYNLSPVSSKPWRKSMVGGSDDHGGLYIGETYTVGGGETIQDFLRSIKEGKCKPEGKSGTYFTIGRSIYATGYNFYKNGLKKGKVPSLLDKIINDKRKGRLLERIFFRKKKKRLSIFPKGFFLSYFMRKLSKKMKFLHTVRSVDKINKNLPLYTALFPYLFGLAYQNKDKSLLWEIEKSFLAEKEPLKIAIFADIMSGENFSSMSTSSSTFSLSRERKLQIICCSEKENNTEGVKVFSSVTNFPFPLFPQIHLHIPPLLEILFHCEKEEFTMIHTLTPGPMGIAGVIASKILNVPVIGTYDPALSRFVQFFNGSSNLKRMLWQYLGWYYRQMQIVIATSEECVKELKEEGIPPERIKILPLHQEQEKEPDLNTEILFAPDKLLQTAFLERISPELQKIYREMYS